MQLSKEDINLWQQMADLTYTKCRQTCKRLGNCCDDLYCEAAEEFAETHFNQSFKKTGNKVRYLNDDGTCNVPPQFRVLCTIQQCKISSFGADKDDPEWTEKYWNLRNEIESRFMVE